MLDAVMQRSERAWIETRYDASENRTEWRIVVDGDVRQSGRVQEDVTGLRAHDEALQWALRNGLTLEGWKHATGGYDPIRARTSTDQSAPMRLYGWARCAAGEGCETVGVTPQQMRDLERGELPCPVCGEGCGAKLDPSAHATATAVTWTGTRWH